MRSVQWKPNKGLQRTKELIVFRSIDLLHLENRWNKQINRYSSMAHWIHSNRLPHSLTLLIFARSSRTASL